MNENDISESADEQETQSHSLLSRFNWGKFALVMGGVIGFIVFGDLHPSADPSYIFGLGLIAAALFSYKSK